MGKRGIQASRRRITKIRAAMSEVREEKVNRLAALYGFVCLRCGSLKDITVDHIIPVSLRGSNGMDNLQLLCLPCNHWKADRMIDFRPFGLVEARRRLKARRPARPCKKRPAFSTKQEAYEAWLAAEASGVVSGFFLHGRCKKYHIVRVPNPARAARVIIAIPSPS